jgi:hypothetical protein
LLNGEDMRIWLAFMSVLLVLPLAGCGLYFGGGDDGDDAPCVFNDLGAVAAQYRDPSTGTCVGGSWEDCDEKCGNCPATGELDGYIDMGSCQSACSGLDQATCEATSGCYAAIYDDGTALKPEYGGCWQTAPSGPVQGTCANLDAFECSRHDDCELIYGYNTGSTSRFFECRQEASFQGCGDVGSDCAPGYHCEEQCYPSDDPACDTDGMMGYCQTVCVSDGNSCAAADCAPGYTCVESCELLGNGTLQCGPQCVPNGMDPGTCTGPVACDALPPTCPSGTTAGIRDLCWSGYCIPNSECGPGDPGECYGTVTCSSASPACPSGTTPGVENGCYTGYCIPASDCPIPACESLSSENACTARGDCTPVYTGTDCTCYPGGCTCEAQTFERCDTAFVPF